MGLRQVKQEDTCPGSRLAALSLSTRVCPTHSLTGLESSTERLVTHQRDIPSSTQVCPPPDSDGRAPPAHGGGTKYAPPLYYKELKSSVFRGEEGALKATSHPCSKATPLSAPWMTSQPPGHGNKESSFSQGSGPQTPFTGRKDRSSSVTFRD